MVTPDSFRTDFPEFADTTTYPDSQINLWLTVAASLVNAGRWMELTDIATELVCAHYLVIGARDHAAAAVGGVPGEVKGPTASKSIDKVSASYDTSAVTLSNQGFWGLSSYGVRFYSLALMMGAGGMQF